MSVASQHAEWLTLVPHSGPFFSIGVLKEAFPNGLRGRDTDIAAELRAAYETWSDPEGSEYGKTELGELHEAFVLFVLQEVLELDDEILARDDETRSRLSVDVPVHGVELRPDAVVLDGDEALMLVSWVDRSTPVDEPLPGDGWAASPRERMAEHLKEVGCPLGLVADGERWTLVSWREGEAPGFATWWASLWLEERITLQAFRTLLGEHRFFSVPEEETLAALLERSAQDQSEVTTKLGNQTLEAVEILIQTIDKLDRDRGGRLLADVEESTLYDAAVTVMMRLIFLFFAEENELLPTGEDLYLERYAASSLRAQLQDDADQFGEQVLETRSDAWSRLLATWRAVYAGVEHGDMRLAPYGGSLFDPDRYPFLEGRLPGSTWRDEPADPLPVDNRTVLHLLNALQTLAEGGQRRKLSFRGLDVEQIGHVYEGMLDHTAERAEGWVLGLTGVGGNEPEVPLKQLEGLDVDKLVDVLKDRTGRNNATTKRWLMTDMDEEVEKTFGHAWAPSFEGDMVAEPRVRRFAKFIREDSHGAPAVFPPGSVYVCDSSHRGATGTHYTPRALTEEIVRETLEPLVYDGPADGKPEDAWALRSPEQILDLKVADPACGSGAFLVQSCRYLAEKLAESRRAHGDLDHDPTEDDLVEARREIAARCLYGVDKNEMAVEMAKLSLWLVTLARDRPFSFVDHALGVGDSLFGLTDLDQLRYWSLSAEGEEQELFAGLIADEVERAIELRRQVEGFPVMDHADAELKAMLLKDAEEATDRLRALADLLFAPSLTSEKESEIDDLRASVLLEALEHLDDPEWIARRVREMPGFTQPFHWAIAFPEVFQRGGFDGIVGNPPFLGGRSITTENSPEYREYLVEEVAGGLRGAADLSAYFFLRAYQLLRHEGCFGLLAVNTISEGDTRQVGLEPLIGRGASIYSTHPNEPWPNKAAVVTSRVQIHKGSWDGALRIDDRRVGWISGYLTDRAEYTPEELGRNAGVSFQGSIVLGSGFILTPDEAELLLEEPKNEDILFPYLNGADLNQGLAQRPSRWVITFWDWPEAEAQRYTKAYAILKDRVYPERLEKSESRSYRRIMEMWWRHWNVRPELFHAIGRGKSFHNHPRNWDPGTEAPREVIATARVGKYWAPSLIPNEYVPSEQCVIFASDSPAFLALLLSCVHAEWAWKQASKLKRDLRYTPSDCFETFPLPEHGEIPTDDELYALGSGFHELRREIMHREEIGLTDLYNRLHDPEDETEGLGDLRDLQVAIDRHALELYDWDDIELDHDFRDVSYLPPNDCRRFAISEAARLELLDRLGRLNLERYEEEVRAGLHGKEARRELEEKAQKTAKKSEGPGAGRPSPPRLTSRQTDRHQGSLFGAQEDS